MGVGANIAMWSGPRNISTALMYAFAARDDCKVWDEPFYAWYLTTTDIDHPMGDEIMADGIKDADEVIRQCTAVPEKLHYQKHMTQHMLENLDRKWLSQVKNAFLIRSPEKVLASYSQKREAVTLQDIGYVQQLELFKQVADQTGKAPPVIDSDKFLADPQRGLQNLCAALDIPYTNKMLSWPKGPKPFDGIWAKHWYNAAHESTGFAKPVAREVELSDELRGIADEAEGMYLALLEHSF